MLVARPAIHNHRVVVPADDNKHNNVMTCMVTAACDMLSTAKPLYPAELSSWINLCELHLSQAGNCCASASCSRLDCSTYIKR
jgi:hypothetical protein